VLEVTLEADIPIISVSRPRQLIIIYKRERASLHQRNLANLPNQVIKASISGTISTVGPAS
jgi:hypothetical protein